MEEAVYRGMEELGIKGSVQSVLQDKDSVSVARISCEDGTFILKAFQGAAYRREIENYRRLSELGVSTIRMIADSESSLLLEDISQSPVYRLGIPEDMSDPIVAERLAAWYRRLHTKGYGYVAQHGDGLYDESGYFARDNIRLIREQTGTKELPVWKLLEREFDGILALLQKVRRTLVYNDFYYTNMVVARDKSSALMLDYNLLGKGYAYADLRNVTASLSPDAGKAFMDAYGSFDPVEAALDDVVGTVVTLYSACCREQFPNWAETSLSEIATTFAEKVINLRMFL